jgi:hypothetical protein
VYGIENAVPARFAAGSLHIVHCFRSKIKHRAQPLPYCFLTISPKCLIPEHGTGCGPTAGVAPALATLRLDRLTHLQAWSRSSASSRKSSFSRLLSFWGSTTRM